MLNNNVKHIIHTSYITVFFGDKTLTFKSTDNLEMIKKFIETPLVKNVYDTLSEDVKNEVGFMTNIKKVVKVLRTDEATDVESNEHFSLLVEACKFAGYSKGRDKALALIGKYVVSGDKNVECDLLEKALYNLFDKEQMVNNYLNNTAEEDEDLEDFIDKDDNDEWNNEDTEDAEDNDEEEFTFEVKRGILHVNNKALVGTKLIEHVIESIEHGVKSNNYINFLKKVLKNPRKDIKDELFQFLTSSNFPIAEDGDFYAYKKVRDNYTDCYSGQFDNSPSQVVKMERSEVCDDRETTCSHGLHFASFAYAKSFQEGKMMIVKVNPEDVVSIPSDYNNEKGRACQYKVICEMENPSTDKFNDGDFKKHAKKLLEIERNNDAKKSSGTGFEKF